MVKTITVTEEAYNMLKRLKEKEESFSKEIIRITQNKSNLNKFFGILDEGSYEDLKNKTKEARKALSESLKRRTNAIPRHFSSN